MNQKPSKDFYRAVINQSLFPFWDKAVDRKNGGIFTCFENSSDKLLSRGKFVWSQGRFLWMWCRLIENIRLGNIKEPDPGALGRLEEDARRTIQFLLKNCFMDNGNVIHLLSETGEPKTINETAPLDASLYSDCYVCQGFSEYARVFKEGSFAYRALELYRSIAGRLEKNEYNLEPYPLPYGCTLMGIVMWVMYTGNELARSLFALGKPEATEAAAIAEKVMRRLENDYFVKPYNLEVKGPASMDDTLIVQHLNAGHLLEGLWFYIQFKDFLRETKLLPVTDTPKDTLALADTLGRWSVDHGWDNEKGGFFRFTDRNGGEPKGRLEDGRYEKLVIKTWDIKLWWVHSESLYFSALMAKRLEKNEYWQKTYEKIFDYTFSVFPNPDKSVGEWIQIRRRDGTPLDEVVALPVKDPFHTFRNILLLLEL